MNSHLFHGEWWIQPSHGEVTVRFADGACGDSNHEGIAREQMVFSLLDLLGSEHPGNLADYDAFLEEAMKQFVQDEDLPVEEGFDYRDAVRNWLKSEFPDSVWLMGCNAERDCRDLVTEHLGWKTVHGTAIGTYRLTATDFDQIAEGIDAILEEDGCMDDPDPDQEFLIRVVCPARQYSVTYKDLVDRNYSICFLSPTVPQPAKCAAVEQMDKEMMPACYDRLGD